MNNSSRVIVNTAIQYIRIAFSVLITLYTSRILLEALGEEDYGIYALISGVVFMLAFIQNTLTSATQRYLSFHQGREDCHMQKMTFQNSLFIQISISILLVIILISIYPLLLNGFLDIPSEKLESASVVYFGMIAILFLSMLSTPFIAVLVSHENILFSSIVLIANSILKVPIVLLLSVTMYNKLELYVICMTALSFLDLLLYYVYCKVKYVETRHISLKNYNKGIVKEIFGFVGWSVYYTACFIVRNQGIAIILNKVAGPIANASYGLSRQVSGQLYFLSTSVQNAIKPQLIKAEGSSNRNRMFRLSEVMSKFSFLLLASISLPIIFEMPILLSLWLKNVPEYTVFFCRALMITCLIDQITIGLSYANEAIANLKLHSLLVGTTKLLTIPIAIVSVMLGFDIEMIMYYFIIIEFISAILRIPILHKVGQLDVWSFVRNVLLRVIPPICITILYLYFMTDHMAENWRFAITIPSSAIILITFSYLFSLCNDEKQIINTFIGKFYNKVMKQSSKGG